MKTIFAVFLVANIALAGSAVADPAASPMLGRIFNTETPTAPGVYERHAVSLVDLTDDLVVPPSFCPGHSKQAYKVDFGTGQPWTYVGCAWFESPGYAAFPVFIN